MTFLFTETYIKKGQKRSRNYGPYARLIWSTGRRPVYLRRRCKYFVGPFTTNDGPKARLCKFRRRRRQTPGRRPVHVRDPHRPKAGGGSGRRPAAPMYSLCLGSCISRRSACLDGGHADAPQALVIYINIILRLDGYMDGYMDGWIYIYIYGDSPPKRLNGFWCVIYQTDRTDNESVMGYFIFPKNA